MVTLPHTVAEKIGAEPVSFLSRNGYSSRNDTYLSLQLQDNHITPSEGELDSELARKKRHQIESILGKNIHQNL